MTDDKINKIKKRIFILVILFVLVSLIFAIDNFNSPTGLVVYEQSDVFEAEELQLAGHYSVSSSCVCSDPSNNLCIKHNGYPGQTGSVIYDFNLENGLYDILMKHCPENDGNDIYKLYINNDLIKTFEETSDSQVWEEHIFDNIELNQGDEIKISCTRPYGSTYCRIDQITFKKIKQTVNINETIEDADQTPINSTIRWKKDGNIVQESSGEMHQYEMETGDYELEIIPEHNSIGKIALNKCITSDITEIVDVDEVLTPDTKYSRTYAIEPKDPEIKDATVTITATGTELFKCRDWDFETRTCPEENWIKLMDTVPGQEYTFTVDCGYKESGGCGCKGVRFIDLFSDFTFNDGDSYTVTAKVFKGGSTNPFLLIDSETVSFSSLPQTSIDNNNGHWWRGNLIIEKINQSGILIKFHNRTKGKLIGDNTFKIIIEEDNGDDDDCEDDDDDDEDEDDECGNTTVLGPDTIHTSCSQPIDIGDVYGDFEITDINKILSGSDCPLGFVFLISPANNSNVSSPVTFIYSVYDSNQSIDFCELIIDGTVYQTDNSIIEIFPQFFNQNLSNGTYAWSVNCTTSNDYEISSDAWYFTIGSAGPGDKPPETKLNYPPNNFNAETFDTYTLTFNCSAEDKQGTNKGIKNISLYLTDYQNNNFNLNQTMTFSGTNDEETALFTKTLAIGNYTWNCLAYDNGNNSDWAANRTLKIKKKQNITANVSCCCGLQVSTTPEVVGQNEKVLVTADVSKLSTGLAAMQSDITSINATIYRIENNTETVIINNTLMTYLSDGLWYYEFYTKDNATGTYVASVTMLTNQTTPYTKEASDAFTIGERISGLTITGVSPDLININKTTRIAAEIKYNGIAVDSSLILNPNLTVQQINGTTQYYTPQIDDGIIYLDGLFNETGIYYLDWTASYLTQTRTAREIVVVVGWEELLEDINETVNVELVNLIKENRQYLIELLTDMEYLQQFTEEEIFLITDSVNSMTKVINYLEDGEITNEQAEQQFNQIKEELEDKLGIKLTGSAVGLTPAGLKEPSPLKKLSAKLSDWRSLLFFILLLIFSMLMVNVLMLVRMMHTHPAKMIVKQVQPKIKSEKRRYEILIDRVKQMIGPKKKVDVEIQPKAVITKKNYTKSLNKFLAQAVDKGCTKGDIKILLINRGWPASFVDNYCDKFFRKNKRKVYKKKR